MKRPERLLIGTSLLVVTSLTIGAFRQVPGPAVQLRPAPDVPFPGRKTACPGHGAEAIPQLVVAGETTNIPEFNDCQRFVVRDRYDSLFAVFYAWNGRQLLDSLRALECAPSLRVVRRAPPASGATPAPSGPPTVQGGGILNQGPATRLTNTGVAPSPLVVAIGTPADTSLSVEEPNFTQGGPIVLTRNCRRTRSGQWNSVGIAFAEVVSWGGTYAPLGIKPNFSCLYLHDSAALKAVMVHVDKDEKKCAELIDPETIIGVRLRVRASKHKGLGDGDYPAVARWDINRAGGVNIGMYCGGRWCEVAPKLAPGLSNATAFSVQYPASSDLPPQARRVIEVKGWYDEQRLAIPGRNGLRPTSSVATMIPHPDLHTYTDQSFVPGRWLPAAKIVIREDVEGVYKKKLNLEASPDFNKANQVYLCRGFPKECLPPEAQAALAKCKSNYDVVIQGQTPPPTPNWYTRIVSVGNSDRYMCVKNFPHPHMKGKTIWGTVRWAWSDDDEGGWWRCPGSCCYPS